MAPNVPQPAPRTMTAEAPRGGEEDRRRVRRDAGFESVERLAAASGVSHNTIRSWEQGGNVQPVNQRRIEAAIERGADAPTLHEVMEEIRSLRDAVMQLARRLGGTSAT